LVFKPEITPTSNFHHARDSTDGLRAVAVLPVVFYHAGFDFFSGGYVGVDVFFVISGYLIAKLLMEPSEHRRILL